MSVSQSDTLFLNELRNAFASQLPAYLRQQRWFRAKARKIQSVEFADCVVLPLPHARSLLAFARVEFAEGSAETYLLPLLHATTVAGEAAAPPPVIIRLPHPETSSETVLSDALANPEFLAALLDSIQHNRSYAGESGTLTALPSSILPSLVPEAAPPPPGRILKAEQSNSSIVYGDRLILKFYRAVEEGINPELEIGRFLTESAHFPHTPPLCGSLEYKTGEGKAMVLGMLEGFVANQGDSWTCTLHALNGMLSRALAHPERGRAPSALSGSAIEAGELPPEVAERLNAHVAFMGLLGKRTAQMHLALASSQSDPAFVPEPFTPAFREALRSSMHDLATRNFDLLRSKAETLPEELQQTALRSAKLEEDVLLSFHSILEKDIAAMRTRIHGDYHLGQVLFTGSDFLIIDFEGEPARPLHERRAKRSPLQDVAGMLRSFHYAARSAFLEATERTANSSGAHALVTQLLSRWRAAASSRFLDEYRAAANGAPFLPPNEEEANALLRLHLLEKAVYELGYELNNRPAWLAIPLNGIEELVGGNP